MLFAKFKEQVPMVAAATDWRYTISRQKDGKVRVSHRSAYGNGVGALVVKGKPERSR